jgi:antitoxin component of RelBE/YafQ-DinJ toxin-antitoxin module
MKRKRSEFRPKIKGNKQMNQQVKDQVIQIMVSNESKNKLTEVAQAYSLRPSTLGRIIIERHINEYTRNRLFS